MSSRAPQYSLHHPLKTAHRQLRWLPQPASQQRPSHSASYTKQIARRAAGSPILCYELRWPLFGQEEADKHTEAVQRRSSNRQTRLLETMLNHCKQRMATASNRQILPSSVVAPGTLVPVPLPGVIIVLSFTSFTSSTSSTSFLAEAKKNLIATTPYSKFAATLSQQRRRHGDYVLDTETSFW
jgi:hypothetical protein